MALWEPVLEPIYRINGGRGGKLHRWTLDFRLANGMALWEPVLT
jgi:hypothetical protein